MLRSSLCLSTGGVRDFRCSLSAGPLKFSGRFADDRRKALPCFRMPGQDCGLRFAAFDQRSHRSTVSGQPSGKQTESREIWWSCSRRSTISFCKLTTSPVVNWGSRNSRFRQSQAVGVKSLELGLSTSSQPLSIAFCRQSFCNSQAEKPRPPPLPPVNWDMKELRETGSSRRNFALQNPGEPIPCGYLG